MELIIVWCVRVEIYLLSLTLRKHRNILAQILLVDILINTINLDKFAQNSHVFGLQISAVKLRISALNIKLTSMITKTEFVCRHVTQ